MENRNALLVQARLGEATGTAERKEALASIDGRRPGTRRVTLGADKAYDVTEFIVALRQRNVTPHIAIDGHLTKTGKRRKTAIDTRTTRHAGYAISQVIRKRIEQEKARARSSPAYERRSCCASVRSSASRGVRAWGWSTR